MMPGVGNARKVYPRTGGGNVNHHISAVGRPGLSPHGRGKRACETPLPSYRRSIPARAGETTLEQILRDNPGVYPRTGGGNGRVM